MVCGRKSTAMKMWKYRFMIVAAGAVVTRDVELDTVVDCNAKLIKRLEKK